MHYKFITSEKIIQRWNISFIIQVKWSDRIYRESSRTTLRTGTNDTSSFVMLRPPLHHFLSVWSVAIMTAVLASSSSEVEEIFWTVYFQQVTQYQFFIFPKLFCTPSPDQIYTKAKGIRAAEIPCSPIYTVLGKEGITGVPMNTRKKVLTTW